MYTQKTTPINYGVHTVSALALCSLKRLSKEKRSDTKRNGITEINVKFTVESYTKAHATHSIRCAKFYSISVVVAVAADDVCFVLFVLFMD